MFTVHPPTPGECIPDTYHPLWTPTTYCFTWVTSSYKEGWAIRWWPSAMTSQAWVQPVLTGLKQWEQVGFWNKNSSLLLFVSQACQEVWALWSQMYWVGQKVGSGFSIRGYRKIQTNFLANPMSLWRHSTSKWTFSLPSYRRGIYTQVIRPRGNHKPRGWEKAGLLQTGGPPFPTSPFPSLLFLQHPRPITFLSLSLLFLRSTSKVRKEKINIQRK